MFLIILCFAANIIISVFKFVFIVIRDLLIGLYNLFNKIIKRCKKRKKRPAADRAAADRKIKELSAPLSPEQIEKIKEKDRKRIAADRLEIERERKRKFKIMQAEDDIEHLKQQKRDIYKCYAVALDELKNAGTDKRKEAAQNKCIKYDNKIRSLQKQIEKNQFIIGRL